MPEAIELPLSEIRGIEYNVRSRVDTVKLGELKASIQNHGLIHPIVVRPLDSGYEVVAGMRRVIACQQLGFKTIRAEVRELSDDEAEYIKFSENLHREDVSPLDQARFFAYLKERFDLTDQQIADQIGKSRAYVTQRLGALNWPDTLREDLELGELEWSVAMQLARLPDPELVELYRYHAKIQHASTQLAKFWVDEVLERPTPQLQGEAPEVSASLPPAELPPVLCVGCDSPAPRGAPWRYMPLCQDCVQLLRTVRQEMEKMEAKEG